ncbi:2'-5' RNA ligase family protein [Kitasatospora arboriphila]
MHPSAPAAASAFPAEQPSSLTDAQVIAAHDWKAFSEVATMVNHWDRPGWTADRRRLYWFIAADDAPAVHTLAARCQQHLSRPELDLTPPDGLHITLSRAAVARDSDVEPLAAAARERCAELDPFTLQVLPLTGSRGAVRFSLAPWTPILGLSDTLAEAALLSARTRAKPRTGSGPISASATAIRRCLPNRFER